MKNIYKKLPQYSGDWEVFATYEEPVFPEIYATCSDTALCEMNKQLNGSGGFILVLHVIQYI